MLDKVVPLLVNKQLQLSLVYEKILLLIINIVDPIIFWV